MLERGENTLSTEINAATRNLHTALNRLITSRLPLALPPHAADPSLYATGLLHFAHIFLTFESLWADLLCDHATQTPSTAPLSDSNPISPPTSPLLSYLLVNPYDSPSLFTSTLGAPTPPSPQLVAFLQTLRPRGLIRSARVKKDLESLMGLHPTDLEVLLAKYPSDKVTDFCTHIRKTVHEKPWTLVSYAWCFYMAVFSGGRWIRAELLKAGPDFWQTSEDGESMSTAPLTRRGLLFWHFPGQHDGDDIKIEFKAYLAAAETLFTPDERVDIIEEAKNIFQFCASLVDELDKMAALGGIDAESTNTEVNQNNTEKVLLVDIKLKNETQPPVDKILGFIRRPEVTGTMVALGCLACVTLMRVQ